MTGKQAPRKAARQIRGRRAQVSRAPPPVFSQLASSTDIEFGPQSRCDQRAF